MAVLVVLNSVVVTEVIKTGVIIQSQQVKGILSNQNAFLFKSEINCA